MHAVQIPGTSLAPSCLAFGTVDFGTAMDRTAAFALMDRFFEAGGDFIDTAKVYADWVPGTRSASEKVVGESLKARGNRQDIILATKGSHYDLDTPTVQRLKPADILGDLNASLQHLQTDVVDLYWLHRDDPKQPVGEIVETLEAQVKAGKIRYYGASNWGAGRLREAQEFARANAAQGFSAVSNLWSLAKIGALNDPTMVAMDDELWQYHYDHQLAAIPYTSQAFGVFHKLAAGRRDAIQPLYQKMFLNEETERRLGRVQALSEQTGLSITQIVLGYILAQPFPTVPVFSSRNEEQLDDTLAAADVRLAPEQLAFLTGE
jgi:aryl-alcohol dehydrogenase-like predicted oxidoreductase